MSDEFDELLSNLIKPSRDGNAPHIVLDDDDRAFVQRILDSVTTGSKGIFVVFHPNDRMQYILINSNHGSALVLLAKVMQQIAEQID